MNSRLGPGTARYHRPETVIVPDRADVPTWLLRLIRALVPVSRIVFDADHHVVERHEWIRAIVSDALTRRDNDIPGWAGTPLEAFTLDVLIQAYGGPLVVDQAIEWIDATTDHGAPNSDQ